MDTSREHIHFVTGRLAEPALRSLLADLAPRVGFDYSVQVLGITVAALMTPAWVAPRLQVPREATRVLLPGYCRGELAVVEAAGGVPVSCGPKDLRDLPGYFAHPAVEATTEREAYDIQILAEINHAPRLAREELLAAARALARDGADVIDLGCEPGHRWREVGDAVRALGDAGLRVSIDSFDVPEIADAARAGAELVLSVNATNRDAAPDWGIEVVAVPDDPAQWAGLEATAEWLAARGVPLRIDPVLEPIGFGLAASLERYLQARGRWPSVGMLMGIGNLTELTDVDSAGVNVLLLGICQELGIDRVLTTQVIPWCQTAVRECDLARRLVRHAVRQRVLPKHVEPRLVMLRDPQLRAFGEMELDRLAAALRDPNYRLFAEGGKLHAVAASWHVSAEDPYALFAQILAQRQRPLDAEHAFYLGYELAKAMTALTLGKNYEQDEPLRWGFLTRAERAGVLRHGAQASKAEPISRAPVREEEE